MAELFEEDFFKKREKALQQQVKSQRWVTVLFVVLLVLVVAGVWLWRMKNNPDTMILNINKASIEQLQYLPEIGPATAKAIVDGRPYQTIDDLKKVRGIGDMTFEKIRSRVKVE